MGPNRQEMGGECAPQDIALRLGKIAAATIRINCPRIADALLTSRVLKKQYESAAEALWRGITTDCVRRGYELGTKFISWGDSL